MQHYCQISLICWVCKHTYLMFLNIYNIYVAISISLSKTNTIETSNLERLDLPPRKKHLYQYLKYSNTENYQLTLDKLGRTYITFDYVLDYTVNAVYLCVKRSNSPLYNNYDFNCV